MLIFKAHAKPITAVAFSPNMTMLATASGTERIVRLWELTAPGGGLLEKPKKVREWPLEWAQNVAFSPDSRILVASSGSAVQAWDLEHDAASVIDAKASGYKMCVSSAGVVYAHGFVKTTRWSLPKGKPIAGDWPGEAEGDMNYGAGPVACTSDGTRVAMHFSLKEGPSSRFVVRDAASGKIVARLDQENVSVQSARARFGKDDTLFATSFGPQIVVWDVASQKQVTTISIGKKHVPDLVFTAGGKRLVAVSNDETVRQWDTKTWKEGEVYTWKAGKLTSLDVSSDGCRVASGSQMGKVVIWDVVT